MAVATRCRGRLGCARTRAGIRRRLPRQPAARREPAAPAVEEPSLIGTLLDDPMALGGAGLVVALLAGFGVYRYVKRKGKDSGETSFLESRLQPDSFFGVSGGQRIDTREGAATGAPSSMSYSLSQLDAIGDVDPVAEADVYLAYGRDLQAEEILKEALRGAPDRMAIRAKLLEVYAKRRDTKGFELLATQLYTLTGGQRRGLGQGAGTRRADRSRQPALPAGRASRRSRRGGDDQPHEPLGASTMPQSVLPSPSQFNAMVAHRPRAARPCRRLSRRAGRGRGPRSRPRSRPRPGLSAGVAGEDTADVPGDAHGS